MVPADALYDAAEHALKLKGRWDRGQVIERRLQEMASASDLLRDASVQGFMARLASSSPTPGGGSAACVSGAMGAALGAMTCRLTLGRKGYEAVQGLMQEKAAELDALRERLVGLIDADAGAYEQVMEAFKLPKGTEEERRTRLQRIQDAYVGAAQLPLLTSETCRSVIGALAEIADKVNRNARTDVLVGLNSALAGLQGAAANVRVNLAAIKDEGIKASIAPRLEASLLGAEDEVRKVTTIVLAGL
jgi:formiminotetrahydrofolate cyclodeaminase